MFDFKNFKSHIDCFNYNNCYNSSYDFYCNYLLYLLLSTMNICDFYKFCQNERYKYRFQAPLYKFDYFPLNFFCQILQYMFLNLLVTRIFTCNDFIIVQEQSVYFLFLYLFYPCFISLYYLSLGYSSFSTDDEKKLKMLEVFPIFNQSNSSFYFCLD